MAPEEGDVMKLYVWVDPYAVSYGNSMVFAVARNLREAKKVAKKGKAYAHGKYAKETPEIELGEPTRVVDLPCAEWHIWQE